jgi:ribose transport system permease protein
MSTPGSLSGVKKSRSFKLTQELGAVFALVLLAIVLSVSSPYFFSYSNFTNIIRQVAVVSIAGVGMTLVIIGGGIDLSVGTAISLCSMLIAGFLYNYHMSAFLAVPLVLLIGCLLGLLNGSLITFLHIPPIIATLSTLMVFRGAALVYNNGYAIGLIGMFMTLGRGFVGPFPVPSVIMIGLYVVAFVVLRYTMLGRIISGLGGNEEAVRLAGISVTKYRLIIYMISGFTASLAGIILASRLSSGEPSAGEGVEFDAIVAAVLGGTNIFGGVGTVWGTIIGALILVVISNGLNLLNVSPYFQFIVRGTILAIAVAINSMKVFRKS